MLDENSHVNPLSHYASSKLKCESILKNKNSIIFRLGTLFGVSDDYSRIRMDLVVNTLSAKAFFEKKMSVFGGEQYRPLLHVRDVARAQGKSYSLGDKIAKLIPFSPEMTLERAINESKDLKQILKIDEDASEIFEMALKLEGTTRSVGKHAAGVVIAPSAINDYSPLYLDADTYDENISQSYATQYSMEDIEAVGLQKFDFLGLKTLTVINNALLQINDFRDSINLEPINIDELDLDDKGVFELLQKGITTAVFQMESRGMREYLIKLKPNTFEDIIAMIALYRPGPLEMKMVDTYIDRKNGDENIDYSKDNEVEKILKSTYGVIVYQEQVMQLAQEFSGFTLGQADILRKAMGKKIPEVMESQKESFIEGAQNKNKVKRVAEDLWDQIETFAGYGFNKSHSAAYALISYQTAWLKSHYPSQFMASALSSELDDTDKIKILIDDSHSLGLKINPPDINKSSKNFLSLNEENILFGLGAIKGVGDSAIENIVEERSNGDFKSLKDFCFRVDLSKVDKRCLEPLIKSGAMDIFSNDRFKWLSAQNINIGLAPCSAMRVNFVGELGWELHHPIEYQNHIFDQLMEAGKEFGFKPYGI